MALWPKAEGACSSSSRTVVVDVSMRLLAMLSQQRATTEDRPRFPNADPVNVSGANSVDARRKRAKCQGMRRQMGMGTLFFVGGLSRFGWARRSMRTRQDSSGGGNGASAHAHCDRGVPLEGYLGLYLDQWSMSPRCLSDFQPEPSHVDLSLKLVVFSQVPPPKSPFSV